jgi:hypothetical protein
LHDGSQTSYMYNGTAFIFPTNCHYMPITRTQPTSKRQQVASFNYGVFVLVGQSVVYMKDVIHTSVNFSKVFLHIY